MRLNPKAPKTTPVGTEAAAIDCSEYPMASPTTATSRPPKIAPR
jgi:hypothetical protein